jgi:hypothetical protein
MSPVVQGRLEMDAIVVCIDVSKDKLDIALLPQGETFATSRDAGPIPGVQFSLRPKGTPPAMDASNVGLKR